MASNAHHTNHMASTRNNIVCVNAKNANKDRKLRQSTMPKQHGKRADAPTSSTASSAAAGAVGRAGARAVPLVTSTKPPSAERTTVLSRHIDQVRHAADQSQYPKHTHKSGMERMALKTKNLRPVTAEAGLPFNNNHPKEGKSPERGEAGGHRHSRSKNQSQNSKIFFDKYLKFAYDLSTPEGVRQLEAHFFPPNSPLSKLTRKNIDSGDVTENRNTP